MGSIFLGKLAGPAGFGRMVAIKRLHPHLAREEQFKRAFVDEARLASRVVHPNVVQTLDVVSTDEELLLVMDLVLGEPLSKVMATCRREGLTIPLPVTLGMVSQILQGLHAAHEACDEQSRPLGIIHRDVSPQNALVGHDGVMRLIDFGVAKANGRLQTTEDGIVKGKFAYMAPEQLMGEPIDRRADIYATGVVLWELLAGRRLFDTTDKAQIMFLVVQGAIRRPTAVNPKIPGAIEAIVMKALDPTPEQRFATALEMASALEGVDDCATPIEISSWLATIPNSIAARRKLVTRWETATLPTEEPPRSRRRWYLGAVAMLALLGGGASIAFAVGGADSPQRSSPPVPPSSSATKAEENSLDAAAERPFPTTTVPTASAIRVATPPNLTPPPASRSAAAPSASAPRDLFLRE